MTLRRNLGRTLARYRHLSPLRALAIHWRAARLMLGAQVRPAPPVPMPGRLVVTLTTIPARAGLLAPVLRSLLDQTEPADRIVLAWPDRALRGGAAYPDPATLDLPAGVDVLRCSDLGPATKLLPALRSEPDAVLVVVDDDVIYPRDFLAVLRAAAARHPGAAVGLRGVRLDPGCAFSDLPHVMCGGLARDQAVDVLFGTWGYLLPPGALDDAVHALEDAPPAVRWVDDVWISGHLARRGVPRVVLAAPTLPVETRASWRAALTDGPNRSGANDAAAIAHFAEDWARGPGGAVSPPSAPPAAGHPPPRSGQRPR